MNVEYHKYSGAGNTFLLFDDRSARFPVNDRKYIFDLCSAENVDGVLLLQNSIICDFRYRIFNADGEEASMCGNGLRCVGHYLRTLFPDKESFRVESKKDRHTVHFEKDLVAVTMGTAKILKWSHQLKDLDLIVDILDTGVPHAVLTVNDLWDFDLERLGPLIRHHADFQPKGVNVTLMCPGNPISVRTYERGVEGETLACGTGACAAAIAAHYHYNTPSPISILPPSKEILQIVLSPLTLIGPVQKCSDNILNNRFPVTTSLLPK